MSTPWTWFIKNIMIKSSDASINCDAFCFHKPTLNPAIPPRTLTLLILATNLSTRCLFVRRVC